MIKKKNIIVIGGGFSGMVKAYFASKIFKKSQVFLIEKNNFLGGLYNSVSFKNKFFFDHGMHLFYQCKNKLINNFFFKLLKKSSWIILKGVKKDVAGIFYKGKLKTNSPYIDLVDINSKDKLSYMRDINLNSNYKTVDHSNTVSLKDYFLKKFGKKITRKIISPVIKKFWGHDASKVDSVASRLILMDRVNLFSKKIMDNLIKSTFLRSRLGYPDQLKLPKKYQSKQTYGLYPKKFGMFNVITKFKKILKNSKIKVYLGSSIDSFLIKKKRVNEIVISNKAEKIKIDNISNIFWTVPIFGLIPLLKIKTNNLKLDKNKKQVFVYFLSKERPKMDGNYYFMCFDPNLATFRVTSYFEYCKDSKKINKYYPLCMEMHFKDDGKVLDYKKIALKEIYKFKIINKMSSIKHVFVERATGFFPTMTLNNTSSIKKIKKKINNLNIKNIFLATQSPEKGIFFMHDVLDANINLLYKLKKWHN